MTELFKFLSNDDTPLFRHLSSFFYYFLKYSAQEFMLGVVMLCSRKIFADQDSNLDRLNYNRHDAIPPPTWYFFPRPSTLI